MKIFTIIGARPQFIKAATVSREIVKHDSLQEIILHTGQHFDANMSDIFFEQLHIPRPKYLLDIHGGTHGEMTGRMLIEIEKKLLIEKPNRVLVYGDTNSTLAGALAAAKLHIPVAHVEAGLRSFNMRMPEEINRILTDQVSDLLFCPTDTAVHNLQQEGFETKKVKILNVGDVMHDAALFFQVKAQKPQSLTHQSGFVLATIHRAENTDDLNRLKQIVAALNELSKAHTIIFPVHPRTKNLLEQHNINLNVTLIEPVGYLEMLWLLQHCALVLTDSGGVQKEAYFFRKPCVTMRDETEWTELIALGVNKLAGAQATDIVNSVQMMLKKDIPADNGLYGGGKAAEKVVAHLLKFDSG